MLKHLFNSMNGIIFTPLNKGLLFPYKAINFFSSFVFLEPCRETRLFFRLHKKVNFFHIVKVNQQNRSR